MDDSSNASTPEPAHSDARQNDGPAAGLRALASRFFADYGMLAVLLLLVVFFSVVTYERRQPVGAEAADAVAARVAREAGPAGHVLVIARASEQDAAFAARLETLLKSQGVASVARAEGEPRDIRATMEQRVAAGEKTDVIATTERNAFIVDKLRSRVAGYGDTRVVVPEGYGWPVFLRSDNLLNVANQIVVIAIIAIGMTMVIITGGIDLSVGSLIALSAVTTATLIGKLGGADASVAAMFGSAVAAILCCGVVGLFSGVMVSRFRMPPFIATLGMMLVASGLAYIVSGGESIYQIPDRFVWLGRGTTLVGIPNAVLLMIGLYAIAYIVMSRMTLGRYVYAVGGNVEAARLSGVSVGSILLFVYALSGMMAGLGGVVLSSQLKSGAPTYGLMYELYVIAAVVLGGTSLAGGKGKVIGSLIGALIIGVIQNGMNLTGVESYTQKVVLGLVILGAVLLDTLRRKD